MSNSRRSLVGTKNEPWTRCRSRGSLICFSSNFRSPNASVEVSYLRAFFIRKPSALVFPLLHDFLQGSRCVTVIGNTVEKLSRLGISFSQCCHIHDFLELCCSRFLSAVRWKLLGIVELIFYVRRRNESFDRLWHSSHPCPAVALIQFYHVKFFAVVHRYRSFAGSWKKMNEDKFADRRETKNILKTNSHWKMLLTVKGIESTTRSKRWLSVNFVDVIFLTRAAGKWRTGRAEARFRAVRGTVHEYGKANAISICLLKISNTLISQFSF